MSGSSRLWQKNRTDNPAYLQVARYQATRQTPAVNRVSKFFVAALLAAPAVHAELRIDGVPDEPEWQTAQHITDFKIVQPLTRAVSQQATEAWILATPAGLAVAFKNTQSPDVPRKRQRTQRDQPAPVDRVNVVIDYDGDGATGYNFTVNLANGIMDAVVVNENAFRQDWDGDWQHAAAEQADGWTAEMLIPWYVAPMKDGQAGKRQVGVYLDRVIGATGERVAWPAISYFEPRYLSDFAMIEIPAYSQSLLAITPYTVSTADLVSGGTDTDIGADLFWKPSGRFQLTATVNPDFGQVESDELVVNFGAVETFFSDKRPFFTENQGLFDVPFGLNNSNLIYTRRVGGAADDGSGAADVLAALKLNGSIGKVDYGLLASDERGAAGREFFAFRATRDFVTQDVGVLATQVDSNYRDRSATVVGIDHHWKPNQRWNIVSQWVGSAVSERGFSVRDAGLQFRINHELSAKWRQNLYFVHLGAGLELNDFGFLERNNFNYLRYEMRRRITDLPKTSRYRSQDWAYVASSRRNEYGDTIFSALQVSRSADTSDGGSEFMSLTGLSAGYDDRLTRGNNKVRLPAKLILDVNRNWPRRKHWSLSSSLRIGQSGFEGLSSSAVEAFVQPTYHFSDALRFNVGAKILAQPDWLLWRGGNLLGTFRSQQLSLTAGLQWSVGTKHELRMKLESIALDAKPKQAWLAQANGDAIPVANALSAFSLLNMGFQVRYRYEMAPLSYAYLVYSRGGIDVGNTTGDSLGSLLSSTFSLRDSEQLLLKFNYRFQL